MELRISVQELSRALSMTQGVVQRKNTMPILANVLLDAKAGEGAGEVVISATDLDLSLRTSRPCEVLEPGAVTVPARALADMVRVLPGPDVTLKRLSNNHVEVKSGRTKARLMAMSAEEYPKIPAYDDVSFVEIDSALWSDMVEKTVYAASTDETRYTLNGVLFEPGHVRDEGAAPGALSMVATDGHRLVRIHRTFEDVSFADVKESVILPRKGLSEIRRLLDDAGDDAKTVQLGFHENHAVVRTGSTVLGMRLIEGTFPDYHQVIPSVSDKVVRLSRGDLSAALKRVSVLASDKTQPVKLSLTKDTLEVSCHNPEAGEISDDIAVEYAEADIEVAFNARYLADALATLDDNNVLLKLTDNLSPGVLIGVDETHHLCVVMPMRL